MTAENTSACFFVDLHGNGSQFLDVSWIPEGNPDGQYICRIFASKETPSVYFETASVHEAKKWIDMTMKSFMKLN